MIAMSDADKRDAKRKSSKGNQLKFERDGVWYKADYTGYEGLSEYVVSHFLKKSNLKTSEYVVYEQEEIKYKSQIFMGAASRNFLKEGEQLITLERLFGNIFGVGLNKMIYGMNDHTERLKFLVSKTEELTGLKEFGKYMANMLAIDAVFLNEDRHTHNIAVILCNDGTYRYCPFFDQGAGLLSDTTMDYPLNGDVYELMKTAQARTFCQDFDEQLEIADSLYGSSLRFSITRRDVEEILDKAYGYEDGVIRRVKDIIYEQMRKFGYMFME